MSPERRRSVRFGLPRAARLITARDFRRVYGRGRRVHGAQLVVVALPRRRGGWRLGLSVSKAHGAAVRRNKIKRLLREAFRLQRPTLPGAFDVVLIPRPQPRYGLDALRAELTALVTELQQRPPAGGGRSRRRRS